MLFKIVKLVCQESKGKTQVVRTQREFYLFAKLTIIIDYS